jgi:catechol 2,3-dioxygenase
MSENGNPMSSIDPRTSIGTVRLTVSDLRRSQDFYERTIGLAATEQDDGTVSLGVPGAPPVVELQGDASATPLQRRATGLYHLAILLPTRRDLALALVRLAQAHWPLDGASDHLVSEALYLSDPDGNGIEIYRDRPRDQWPGTEGQIEMPTLPLDLDDVLGELSPGDHGEPRVPAGTSIGHVHLQVADLAEAEAFYSGVLGFDVMVRLYPQAMFISAGGYHHHIGMNTWQSAGAAEPAPGSVGLRSYEILLPSEDELHRVLSRVRDAGLPTIQTSDGATLLRDPSGNGVLLRTSRLSGDTTPRDGIASIPSSSL